MPWFRDGRVWALVVALVALFVIDYSVPSALVIPFMAVPVIVSALFASAAVTGSLATLAVISDWTNEILGTTNEWLWLLAMVAVGVVAVMLARHGRRQDAARDAAEERIRASESAATETALRYRVLTESMQDVVWVLDAETLRFLYVSPSIQALRGYTPEEVMAEPMDSALTPEGSAYVRAQIAQHCAALRSGEEAFDQFQTEEIAQPCKDGSFVWTEAVTRFHDNPDTGRIEVWGVTRDISGRHEALEALAESEEHYRTLAEHTSDVVVRLSAEGIIEWASPASYRAMRWAPEEMVGQRNVDLVHPDDREPFAALVAARAPTGEPSLTTVRIRCGDGSYKWMEAESQVAPATADRPAVRIARLRDVDEQQRAFRELAHSEERFRATLESAPIGMAGVSLQRRFTRVNPALCRLLDRDESWLAGRSITELMDAADEEVDREMRADVLSGPSRVEVREHRMTRADGSHIWVQHSIGLLLDDDGQPDSFVSQFVDITEARLSRERLRFMATHDALTELVNRRELVTRVEAILDSNRRIGPNVGVLFIDLDGLKGINDEHGHVVGDQIIQAVAQRIKGSVRSIDIVSRFGGDEYVIVLPHIHTMPGAEAVADKIQEALVPPIDLDQLSIPVTLSIGVALAEPGQSADTAFAHADAALYEAKRAGRNRTASYAPPPVTTSI